MSNVVKLRPRKRQRRRPRPGCAAPPQDTVAAELTAALRDDGNHALASTLLLQAVAQVGTVALVAVALLLLDAARAHALNDGRRGQQLVAALRTHLRRLQR
jgi:hypothetical protein